jgi:hypothetical protein
LEQSLKNSVEEEFTFLNDEIIKVSKKISIGMEVETAINEFTREYDSEIIQETFDLILVSWKKGAKTPPLVDRMADNIKENRFLQKKVIASVTSYRMFLSLVSIIIAPAMFALAFHLINLIRTMLDRISAVSGNAVMPIPIFGVNIDNADFTLFSVLAVGLISACTSIIISIIVKGSIKENYKEIFLFILGSILSYKFSVFLFSIFFSWFSI